MKLSFLITAVLILFIGYTSEAHSGKPKYHVIIDTDGAIDDMRAVTMFLSGDDIRVLAITCSQGSLLPEKVYEKITSLLSTFYHEGIAVGLSDKANFDLPVWEPFAAGIQWGKVTERSDHGIGENSIQLLERTVQNYRHKVTLIALGSLKTYADWIKSNPEVKNKIEKIIWYNDHDVAKGFNYKVSPESYELIIQSGIQVEIVSGNATPVIIDQNYLNEIRKANTVYSDQIISVHSQTDVLQKIKEKHLKMWDDLVALYLKYPVLFKTNSDKQIKYVSLNSNIPPIMIYETVKDLIQSAGHTNNRVFNAFPTDTALYTSNIAQMMHKTIEKYGMIEWKAVCLTNEIHGHTGIYSIIGAKAGIRAMEYFNVGVNNLEVISYAGMNPPLSCYNDGIQISSGATIGQGLITVSDSISNIPSCLFEFNGQRINLSLKPEIAEQMKNDIRRGVQQYGALTEKYWLFIEELALEYWEKYDRHDIFTIEKLN